MIREMESLCAAFTHCCRILCIAALAAGGGVVASALPAQAGAEAPPPFPEFTFRRVRPPEPGTTQRITIQIRPEVVPGTGADGGEGPPAAAGAGRDALPDGWFWETVSASIGAAGPGRWQAALGHMAASADARSLAAPSLETLRAIARTHGRDILLSTHGTRISPALALAVIAVESGGDPEARSARGAQGLMQLMPATAERFGVADALDGSQNIRGGVAYLDWLLESFGRDPILALAGYNAGEGAVRRAEGVPPYAETRRYVPKVLAAWKVARLLCLTPPELFSDGCVFAPDPQTD